MGKYKDSVPMNHTQKVIFYAIGMQRKIDHSRAAGAPNEINRYRDSTTNTGLLMNHKSIDQLEEEESLVKRTADSMQQHHALQ
mmetsp:Transcript_12051/g.28572  ORF Transcript_12051/g.28572 Transcript_12051/m.28572 type:complete len:83 (+) Transcript_12051:177-425(+)